MSELQDKSQQVNAEQVSDFFSLTTLKAYTMASTKDPKVPFETLKKCPSCMKPWPREARQLSCLHQFCLNCLQGLETGSIGQKQVRCPTCKLLTVIPSGQEVNNLAKPVNVTQYIQSVATLLEKETGDQGSLNCDLCDPVKSESTVYCLRCQKKLCAPCFKAHQKEKTLSGHDTLPIAETVFCKVHVHQLVTSFCFDCDSGLCLKCVLQGHDKSHKRHDLQELVKKNKVEINDSAIRHEVAYSKIRDLTRISLEVKSGVGSDNAYDTLESQLETFKDDVTKSLDDFVSKTRDQVKSYQTEFKKQTDCLETVFTAQQKLRKHAHDILNNCSVIDIAAQAVPLTKLLNTAAEVPPQIYYPACDDKLKQLSQHISEQLTTFSMTYKEGWPYGAVDGATGKVFRSPEKFTPNKSKLGQMGETSYPLLQKPGTKSTTLCREAVLNIGYEVTGIVFDPVGHSLFVKTVDRKRAIQSYSLQWALLASWGGGIGGLAEGGKLGLDHKRGLLLATNSDEVLIVSKSGALVSEITNRDFSSTSVLSRSFKLKSASGIGYCAMDDKYIVSDAASNCVAVVDPDTRRLVRKFGSKGSGDTSFNSPMYLAYDGCGTIPAVVVSDHNNHCVKVFTTQGQLIQVYGGKGIGVGQMHNPCGVCTDTNGRVLVCDLGNQRVLRFSTKEGSVTCECLLNADQLGGSSPRDISLHPTKGLLAVSVALRSGDYNVNVYCGYA